MAKLLSAKNGSNLSATVVAGLGAAAVTAFSLVLMRRRQQRYLRSSHPSHIHEYITSLRGNSKATGMQVVSMYGCKQHQSSPTTADGVGQEKEPLLLYVVTGATSGLGLQTARHLASLPNTYIILGCRNVSLGDKVANELRNSTADANSKKSSINRVECICLDLTSFESVKSFANSVIAKSSQLGVPIHGLINNAGVYSLPGTTCDGYQITFQTNTLSPALLTELILPHTTTDFRVVNVASETMKMIWNGTRKDGRVFPPVDGGGSDWDYALSKACQGLHAHELNLRFSRSNESTKTPIDLRRAFAVEPGLVKTQISRHLNTWARMFTYLIFAPLVRTVDEGTATILFCLLAPEEHLDYGWPVMGTKDCKVGILKPFYYADCMAKSPPRCCRCQEDADLQGKVFRNVFTLDSSS
ncbi:hypothetical protein CTEN210_14845 [Chaetoceros tenuissimus]|uniref:Protochlorophyllide reductase n=1 Tax=Chaetoceros tenuissimus TaxID=426638 RepID=A0AAD3HCQ3_9STRA|nr:hypothetical protein CTEN210_14845 [Chaetoceros tenuissimus]